MKVEKTLLTNEAIYLPLEILFSTFLMNVSVLRKIGSN
jgi:hypothetical protein